jgi:hypothetical protein
MDSLKVLDPERPIREADIIRPARLVRFVPIPDPRAAKRERTMGKLSGYREAGQASAKLNDDEFALGPPVFDQGEATVR